MNVQGSTRRRGGVAIRLAVVMAAVVLGVVGVQVAWASHTFSDVPNASPHHDDISTIAELGITGGCAPGLYCPTDPVRRDQMASFLARTIRVVSPVQDTFTVPEGQTVVSDVLPVTGITVSGECEIAPNDPTVLVATIIFDAPSGGTMDAISSNGWSVGGTSMRAYVSHVTQGGAFNPHLTTVIATTNDGVVTGTIGGWVNWEAQTCSFFWQATESRN